MQGPLTLLQWIGSCCTRHCTSQQGHGVAASPAPPPCVDDPLSSCCGKRRALHRFWICEGVRLSTSARSRRYLGVFVQLADGCSLKTAFSRAGMEGFVRVLSPARPLAGSCSGGRTGDQRNRCSSEKRWFCSHLTTPGRSGT